MTHSTATQLSAQTSDVSQLLFDLKKCTRLVSQFSGCLESDKIAKCTTDGIVAQFDCEFSRIWLVEPDRRELKLVASSGLYTHIEGTFAKVPMGAFKVGKIAQHCIPFLSNCLSEERWVKDRQWAIDNGIQGFAGLPLMGENRALGVIAIFSKKPMAPDFLEVLQVLSVAVANALAAANSHQAKTTLLVSGPKSLSETLAQLVGAQKLCLIGTETALSPAVSTLFQKIGKQLTGNACQYCRLIYEENSVTLEVVIAANQQQKADQLKLFSPIEKDTHQLGGLFQMTVGDSQTVVNVQLPQQPRTPPSPQTTSPQPESTQATDTEATDTEATQTLSPLSAREQEVVELLTQGLRDREIAEQLFISDRTVKFHVKNTLTKLSARTRTQAIFKATQQGWLS